MWVQQDLTEGSRFDTLATRQMEQTRQLEQTRRMKPLNLTDSNERDERGMGIDIFVFLWNLVRKDRESADAVPRNRKFCIRVIPLG